MNQAVILSIVRSTLIAAGTSVAVAKGWLTPGGLEAIVGGVIALLAAAWGVWDKRGQS